MEWHLARGVRIMLEKVADSARKAVKLAEPYKPYGGQFLEFRSISLSTYQTCMKLTRKCTGFCQCFCRHYPHMPTPGKPERSRNQARSANQQPSNSEGSTCRSGKTTEGNVHVSATNMSISQVQGNKECRLLRDNDETSKVLDKAV